MNADPKTVVRNVVTAIAFIACIVVVIVAHQTVGWLSLAFMLAGLAGLLVLLALYNRRHQ
jgi:multisubunit Na+/H+ antiporter MnhB subunit